MLKDNHAEYDRNQTRGIPRPGKALLHGLVYCGECGHKMVVQYKGGTRYICNYLRQQYRTPVCQYIAADPVDTRVVDAFFQALSPVELDVYEQALAKRQQQAERLAKAQAQHLERRRYEAAYCERQFRHVDPAHAFGGVKTLGIRNKRLFEAVPALQGARSPLRPTGYSDYASSILFAVVDTTTPPWTQDSIRVGG